MDGHFSTGQRPQWAVEEEEEIILLVGYAVFI